MCPRLAEECLRHAALRGGRGLHSLSKVSVCGKKQEAVVRDDVLNCFPDPLRSSESLKCRSALKKMQHSNATST